MEYTDVKSILAIIQNEKSIAEQSISYAIEGALKQFKRQTHLEVQHVNVNMLEIDNVG